MEKDEKSLSRIKKNVPIGIQIRKVKEKYKALCKGKVEGITFTYFSPKFKKEISNPLSWGWLYGKIKWLFKKSQWKAPHPGALSEKQQQVFEKKIPELMKMLQEAKIKGNIKAK